MRVNIVVGILLIVFCTLGLVIGITRVGGGRTPAEIAFAVLSGIVGALAFLLVLRVGRRGTPPWAKWLIVVALLAALFVDRLSDPLQLALLSLGVGYVLAFVATIVVRVVLLKP